MGRLSIRSLSVPRIWTRREKSAPSAGSVSTLSARSSTKPATAARAAATTFISYGISRRLGGTRCRMMCAEDDLRRRPAGCDRFFLQPDCQGPACVLNGECDMINYYNGFPMREIQCRDL